MPARELLCQMVGINSRQLTRKENLILETQLFVDICQELKGFFKIQYKNYFSLMKYSAEMENIIMETKFVSYVINDILSTNEYTLLGIANYAQIPEEVIYEIAMGLNTSPSALLLRKIIELHRLVRRDLYCAIIKKVITNNLI